MKRGADVQGRARDRPWTTIPAAERSPRRWMAFASMTSMLLAAALPLAAVPPVREPDACATSDTLRAVRALSRTVALVFEGKSATGQAACRARCSFVHPARDAMTAAH